MILSRSTLIAFLVVSIVPVPSFAAGKKATPKKTPAAAAVNAGQASPKGPYRNTMEVAQAVVVTVELDFQGTIPTIAEALRQVERRHEPDDKLGRTFAILDGWGEPTKDGKLQLSMHVSSEKPGKGSLVFMRTGETLWAGTIVPPTKAHAPFTGKELSIYLDDGHGTSRILDGSGGISSVLDAKVKDLGIPVRAYWDDGTEREATFVYSACGCPVKVLARRMGERTVRTKDQPVIFPDDPAAVTAISGLMRW